MSTSSIGKGTPDYCLCGHHRAEHCSDNYDLVGHLEKCLVDDCHCEEYFSNATPVVSTYKDITPDGVELARQVNYLFGYKPEANLTEPEKVTLKLARSILSRVEGGK